MPPVPIQIKTATQADASLIARLSRQTFAETFAAYNTPADMELFMNTTFGTAALMAEVSAPGNYFLLAYAAAEPVGYARLLATAAATDLEIARLYATQNAIGKGVGKALMQAGLNVAIHQKKERVWLGVWEHNARAIAFYKAWGFEKVGTHEFVLGTDVQCDWIMEKRL